MKHRCPHHYVHETSIFIEYGGNYFSIKVIIQKTLRNIFIQTTRTSVILSRLEELFYPNSSITILSCSINNYLTALGLTKTIKNTHLSSLLPIINLYMPRDKYSATSYILLLFIWVIHWNLVSWNAEIIHALNTLPMHQTSAWWQKPNFMRSCSFHLHKAIEYFVWFFHGSK